MTIRKENSDFIVKTNLDTSYCGKERFGIIGEAEPIFSKDKLHPVLASGCAAIFNSQIDDGVGVTATECNPESLLNTTISGIGDLSMTSETQIGISGLRSSTNVFADGCFIEKEFTSEVGFLTANKTVPLENNFGLIPGIENENCGFDICDALVSKSSINDFSSINIHGGALSNRIGESACLASFNVDACIGSNLNYANGKLELLNRNASLEGISYRTEHANDVSFLVVTGNSLRFENHLLGVGIDSDYELGALENEEDLLVQTVNEALEEIGKSFKMDESKISMKSFTKTCQSNSLFGSGYTINMTVVNFINVEGDAKHNHVYITENNNDQ